MFQSPKTLKDINPFEFIQVVMSLNGAWDRMNPKYSWERFFHDESDLDPDNTTKVPPDWLMEWIKHLAVVPLIKIEEPSDPSPYGGEIFRLSIITDGLNQEFRVFTGYASGWCHDEPPAMGMYSNVYPLKSLNPETIWPDVMRFIDDLDLSVPIDGEQIIISKQLISPECLNSYLQENPS
jgi:hypothetical protein